MFNHFENDDELGLDFQDEYSQTLPTSEKVNKRWLIEEILENRKLSNMLEDYYDDIE